MAASQLTAQPGNSASISMLDWTNGEGTAWYWVVKMFVDTFGSDTKSVHPTYINGKRSEDAIRVAGNPEVCIHTMRPKEVAEQHVDALFAQGLTREASGQRIVLLTNTKNETLTVLVPGAKGGSLRTVDYGAGYRLKKWGERSLPSDSVTMSGFGVGLVLLGSP